MVFDGMFVIVLIDILIIDVFLNDFNCYLVNVYDGVCYDLGCLFCWGDKMIVYYQQLGIDFIIKFFIFLDGLDFD